MSAPQVAFLGGNGHCQARLDPARAAMAKARAVFELRSALYPGFEGRPRATDFEDFLAITADSVTEPSLVYATGIGGLLALSLRARGRWLGVPLVLQAPVLWGLEHRWFPKIMRFPGMARAVFPLFSLPAFQRRFMRKHFRQTLDADFARRFFEGYRSCTAFPDFFDWLRPGLLRKLEQRFAQQPEALDNLRFHWGDADSVVGLQELALTEAALDRQWPVERFADWGHYPMIDAPESWIEALSHALENPSQLP